MKPSSTQLRTDLDTKYALTARPKLVAEWNLNRYFNPAIATGHDEDEDGFDIDLFPIESIIGPHRPTRGICKLIANGRASLRSPYKKELPTARYYPASIDNQYKYWASPFPTNTSSTFNAGQAPVVTVSYRNSAGANVSAPGNKVVIKLENSDFSPTNYKVSIKRTPAAVEQVVTNPVINSNGEIVIVWNGSSWQSGTTPVGQTTIHSIKFEAGGMSAPRAHLFLIEVSGRLELDISEDIETMSSNMTMGEVDMLTPIGTLSSNTADVTLINDAGRWSPYNTAGPFYGMLDKNIKMTGGWVYNVGAGTEYVQEFEMYTDEWSFPEDDSVSVSLVDESRRLQEIKPNPSFMNNISAQQAAWMLLDSIGFNKYKVGAKETSSLSTLEVFWVNGEQSTWEILQEISRATQMAIYFDSFGVLNIRARDEVFDRDRTPVTTLRKESSGSSLSNIETLEVQETYEPNRITVTYQPTSLYKLNSKVTATEVVWEPEESDVALRANAITASLTPSDNVIKFTQSDAALWPYEGVMNIQGEFITYSGKQYRWYDNRTAKTSYITSHEEKEALDYRSSGLPAHKGYFTGNIRVTERGAWGTEAKQHRIDLSGWSLARRYPNGTLTADTYGLTHNKRLSQITLRTVQGANVDNHLYFYRGGGATERYYWLGTRFKLVKGGGTHNRVGIMFNSPALGRGYYVEVRPTAFTSASSAHTVYVYSSTGSARPIFDSSAVEILEDKWYDLDVEFYNEGSTHVIEVRINGRVVCVAKIPSGANQHAPVSRFGIYARGSTRAQFEYAYAFTNPAGLAKPEQEFFSRVWNSWYTDQAMRDFIFETRMVTRRNGKKNKGKVKQRYNRRLFDEFGPIAHEIREFNVKFDADRPVREARLYSSNFEKAAGFDFVAGPFGANFVLANTSRSTAILRGPDPLILGDSGEQHLFVYGKTVQQREAENAVFEDQEAIRRRGVIDLEFSSKWIQNKTDAEQLGKWITQNWSNAGSGLEVSIFGNPLLELGDAVRVSYDYIDGVSDKYYVTAVSNSWDNGVVTNLTLRRINL